MLQRSFHCKHHRQQHAHVAHQTPRPAPGAPGVAGLHGCRSSCITRPHAAASGAAAVPPEDKASTQPVPPAQSPSAPEPPKTVWGRVKGFFAGGKLDRERLAALGMGAFASYGVISNVNYGTALTISWLAFVKKNGVAPTAPGQWPEFLAFYAGMWAVQNFARPLRLSLAIALAPFFDRLITKIGDVTRLGKNWGFGILLVVMSIVTCTTLFGTIYLLGGFPPTPAAV